ncbi:AAA domain-containing protein [Sutcliffiella horikoshii]|uniref:AAA domain-containing protein n=1 Tax=Sutcliffiella horikoshii TaxID=79883 RepID=UPI001F39BFA0|nr:AAA domain-containing protein [Sutcliffiella horikoshii]MCG1020921.1 DNA helicase [Sutcliffiella horikoshii]
MKTSSYIKEWKKALQAEIQHLKKYGSTKYLIKNGHLVTKEDTFTYFFETYTSVRIPVGSQVKVEWGGIKTEGKILSSEGKNVIISFGESLGDMITEAYLFHDPWELLDQLIQRLDEIKESKKKRARINRLMNPVNVTKHPTDIIKSNVHELILRSKYNPVTFVWGPPGTGKTYTLARVAANKYFKKKKVLLLSHSNQSVDVLMREISSFLSKKERYTEGDVLRYGSHNSELLSNLPAITSSQLLQNRDPRLAEERDKVIEERKYLKIDLSKSFSKRDSESLLKLESKVARILEKIRQKELEFLQDAYITGTTLAKAAMDPAIYEKDYDVIILDEASMAYVPQAAFATSMAKHIIICGDFKQLPPIASARHELVEKWLREDVFHRTGVADSVHSSELHPQLFLLQEQRRMHPDISSFTNKYIYHSLVGDHPSVSKARIHIARQQPFPDKASILLSTSFTGEHAFVENSSKSRINLWHLLQSFQLIHEAYMDGARSIGYISPYRAQAQWMDILLQDLYQHEKETADIMAATVHRFQGSERDVIIFDSVDSYPLERPGMLLLGKESERLLNVAVTRTKGKFVHISDTHFIKRNVSSNKMIRKLVEFQEKSKLQVHPHEIGSWIKHQHHRVQWQHARKWERVFEDMEHAYTSILMGLPNQVTLPEEWEDTLKKCKIRVSRLSGEVSFPFVMIDNRILWLGIPVEATRNTKPPYVSVRVDSEAICREFIHQVGL